jgi:hypothetical protein
MFKQIDCSNLVQTTQKMMAEAFAPHTMFSRNSAGPSGGDNRRKRRRTKNKNGSNKNRNGKKKNRKRRVDGTNIWQF